KDAERDAGRTAFVDLQEAHDKPIAKFGTPTWRIAAAFSLGLLQGLTKFNSDSQAKRLLLNYRNARLGREGGDTLLAELSPYRGPHRDVTIYNSWRPTEQQLARDLYTKRQTRMLSHFTDIKPNFIVCYGRTNWDELR